MKIHALRPLLSLLVPLLLLMQTGRARADLPSAPENLQAADVSSSHVLLTWVEVPAASSYKIYRYDEGTAAWLTIASDVLVPRYRDYLMPSFPATYAVAAVNAEGEGQAATVTQPEALADFVIYVYWPDESYHTVTSTNAIISWTINVLSGADGMLELGTSPTNFDHFVGYDTNYALWHTFNASNLTPTTVYYYRLTTVGTNRGGFSYVNYFATTYPNRPPTADDVNTGTWSGEPVTISLSGSDPDFDWLTGGITDPPTNGTLWGFTFNGWNGSVTYTPNPGVRGLDHFTYSLSDGSLFSAPALVTIDNFLPYRPPVIASQSLTNAEDNPITIILLATDPEGGEVTFYTSDGPTPHGTLDQYGYLGTNNVLVYTPAPNYNGQDSFTVYAYNAQASASATISLTITPVNDAPSANAQSLTTAEDTALNITLAGSDPDGNTLTFGIVTAPAHGTLSGTGASRTYTPAANYNGPDNFTFKVNDGTVDSAPATISLTVTPVNDAPSANAQSLTTAEDTALNITLAGSDLDGDALTFSIVAAPAHGTLSGTGANRTYTPAANYNGPDNFTFKVNDGTVNSAPATISLTVTPVNDVPSADAQSLTTAEDTALNLTLAGSDLDGDALTFSIVAAPAHGTLSGTGASRTYTPAANYNGPDNFTFKVNDGTGDSAPATVSLTVTPVNDAPSADAQSLTTAEDTALNITLAGSDLDGDALTFSIVTAPAHGTLSGAGASRTYTPAANYNGPDNFTFKVNDGTVDSATATISLTVTPVNDAPSADAQSLTTAEDTALNITLAGSDPDGDALTFSIVTAPAHGTLSGVGASRTYTPAANYNGPDNFTFKVNDGTGDSAPATISLTVTPVNDAPSANAQSLTTAEDTALNITLAGSDLDGDALTFSIVAAPAHGTLSGAGANRTYTPAANYNGPDNFTFKVNDGAVNSAPATVSLTVTPVNDVPSANGQSVSTPYNTAVSITLTGSDPDGSALTFTVLTSPANGALSGTAPNLTFTPTIGWSGTTSFTFRVNDGALNSSPATVIITVNAATSIPAAPSGLSATAVSSTQINLAWTDTSANEDGFKIERSNSGSSWSQIATVGPNTTTYSSTGLSANKTYYYRVRAYNVLGNSAYSNTSSAKTLH